MYVVYLQGPPITLVANNDKNVNSAKIKRSYPLNEQTTPN